MSSTASNYDVTKLATGQAVAAIGLFFAGLASGPTIINSWRSSLPFIGISVFYGIMMFASSYVEEEQHFWYWTTTAWLMILWIKASVTSTTNLQIAANIPIATASKHSTPVF